MLKITKLAALAILGIVAASSAYADSKPADNKPAENKSAIVVNGVTIPQARVDLRVKMVTNQGQPDTPELRKAISDDLINVELMSQEALKKGLDKDPETVELLALNRETALVGAFVQDYLKTHPISDADVSKEYDKLKTSLGGKEYHVRHILVENEKEAKSIEAKLKKGAKFDQLAARYSKDAGSKVHGGDLGWIPVGNISKAFVQPFGDALMGMSKGQVSQPVQSQYGWHIIQLEDVRDLQMPSVEDLKPKITKLLQQQAVKQMISDLREKAKIAE